MKSSNNFQEILYVWFKKYGRNLPWRATRNPYNIWVSEIMLQQTQVKRVELFYKNFIKRFPTIHDLAQASWEELLEYWRGLGYYRRARNLHQTSKIIVKEFDGIFPQTLEELKKLPGIGNYTAAAIVSFAFGRDVPALDTNLKRVLNRILGPTIEKLKPQKQFQSLSCFIEKNKGALFNQSLMDFGSLICTARTPQCFQCPLQNQCFFYIQQLTSKKLEKQKEELIISIHGNNVNHVNRSFPRKIRIKLGTMDKRIIKVAIGVVVQEGKILITKRPIHVPAGGLWEFPGGKLEKGENERACLKRELQEEIGIEVAVRPAFYRIQTDYEKQTFLLSFHRCSIMLGNPQPLEVDELLWVTPQELSNYEFPHINSEIINLLQQKKKIFFG